ncbi:MAG TPA: hydroxyacid dehydrogenase [bacterium]|nr:hydroxyacid dehydrogenase [bacterium]
MAPRPRILITDKLSPLAAAIFTERGIESETRTGLGKDELADIIGRYDGVAVRSATKVTAKALAKANGLKIIGRAGIGVDNIDLDAASEREIRVVNTPGATTVSVAELTLGAIFSLARWIHAADASVKAGEWERSAFQGFEVRGKLLGIIGFGRIGKETGRLAQAVGMRVIACDPYLDESHVQGVPLHPLEEILSRADFVSLHIPFEEESKNLLNRDRLESMKRGAYLLNFGRGGIVDEEALADLLDRGHLAGAALDTYNVEPPGATIDRLRRHRRVLLLPHIGAQTREGQIRVGMELVDGVAKAVKKVMSDRATALAKAREEAELAAQAAGGESEAAPSNE